ncbi:MAG TPA: agmatinase [Thermohalobaculum sp.]|nr:agmatinase [Thermohalobaculum sp.]
MTNSHFRPVDATKVPRFADIATFMRVPRHDIDPQIDIGLIGVPFDLGLNFRSGPRDAPSAVRQASRLLRLVHPVSGVKPYDLCAVADLGDAPVNPMSKDLSLALIQGFYDQVRDAGIRPISIGGDHTIPLPILCALAKDGPVGILQIDSHADILDEICGDRVNHATIMRRGYEEGLIDGNRVVQIGLRGSRFGDDDIKFGQDAGYRCITVDEYEEMGRAAAIAEILKVLGDGPVYITLDVDGLDPSFCPGTPVPEIGGLTPRDVQVMLRALSGCDVVGADICEVAPCYDPTGITSVTAANMMFEMLCLVAGAVDRARG